MTLAIGGKIKTDTIKCLQNQKISEILFLGLNKNRQANKNTLGGSREDSIPSFTQYMN